MRAGQCHFAISAVPAIPITLHHHFRTIVDIINIIFFTSPLFSLFFFIPFVIKLSQIVSTQMAWWCIEMESLQNHSDVLFSLHPNDTHNYYQYYYLLKKVEVTETEKQLTTPVITLPLQFKHFQSHCVNSN